MKLAFRAVVACVAALASVAHAAGEAPDVPAASGFGVLFQGLLGLAVVLAAMMGFFWFLRRFSPGQKGAQGVVKIVGGVMLGPRERLVVVEVGETWLLVGVGGGQVSALHTMPRPPGYVPPAVGAPAGFANRLKDFLPGDVLSKRGR